MDVPDDLEITMSDIRAAGFCPRVQGFFRQHGIYADLQRLIKGGSMPAARFLATGDPRTVLIVQRKLEREAVADG